MKSRDVLTIPNLVTLLRLSALPWYVQLMRGNSVVGAAFVLGTLGATDWLDGFLARRLGQVSELGKVLDPVADRLVFFVGVTTAIWYSGIPLWFGAAILTREIFVATMMLSCTAMGMERFPVTNSGKWATFLLLWAVPWILVGAAGGAWVVFEVIGWCLGLPGIVISYVTAVQYVPLVRAHMKTSDYREAR